MYSTSFPDSEDEEVETGIAHQRMEQENFMFHPNPVSATLHVQCTEKLNYELRNIAGSLVGSGVLFVGKSVVSVSHLNSGLYILIIRDEHSNVKTHRLVVE